MRAPGTGARCAAAPQHTGPRGSARSRRRQRGPGGPGRWPAAAALAVAVLTGAAACSGSGTTPAASSTSTASATPSAPAGTSPVALQQQYERVVAKVLPSVVQISTSTGTGSGVVYDSKGDIVTNAHVVGSATTVSVSRATGGKALPARVVGVFTPDDLAVVRVESGASTLHPAVFAKSSVVQVGEIVLAMGNPLGLTGTVTEGIVSATGRTVSEGQGSSAVLIRAIQTSAPINPGNSGGALVDLAGGVIGIPTLAATDPQLGGAAVGIGFAIPSDTVSLIAPQLIATGKVTHSGRAELGVTAETVANASGQPAGVGVVSVIAGGPAAKAGIQAGDVILSVKGQTTDSVAALQSVLATLKPGDKVAVTFSRNGSQHTVTVTLGTLTT